MFPLIIFFITVYIAIAAHDYFDAYPIKPRTYFHKNLFSKKGQLIFSLLWLPIYIFLGIMFTVRWFIHLFRK